MTSVLNKASRTLKNYRELLLERPSPYRIKRFLLAVNGWCNSKCTFCSIWQYDKAQALREEITLAELERNLFSSMALTDVLNIGLTGGEPFLRRDLVQLCTALYDRFQSAEIGVVTNALLTDKIAEGAAAIMAASPGRSFSVAISLDGYGETHDRVRGVPGNFQKVLQTLDLLKSKAPDAGVGFSHTVTPSNYEDSLRCYELAKERGVGFFYRLAHESPYLRNEGGPIWSPETLKAVRPVVDELNRRRLQDQRLLGRIANTGYASIAFYGRIMDYFDAPRRTFDCFSGTHSFFLAHDGELYPCINLPHSIGNIRKSRFDDVWFSKRAEDMRAPIAAWDCHCWTNCETEFSLGRQKSAFVDGLATSLRSVVSGS
jgi:radical SAM protein with 4Fe4S-binding SPASM domain